jgi:hypothetical protein
MSIDNTVDILDSRDVLRRLYELNNEPLTTEEMDILALDSSEGDHPVFEDLTDEQAETLRAHADSSCELDEWVTLRKLVEGIRREASGSPEDGVTLVRHTYLADYARELAHDMGAIDSGASWPINCIDWDEAADQLCADYGEVVFDGVAYLVAPRSSPHSTDNYAK